MTLDYAKHQQILLEILKLIYEDSSIGSCLGFKGGTAANMFYGLPRHSVDLDFDLLDESREAEVFDKIKKIIALYGTIDDSKAKHFSLLNVISYAPGAHKIKVEVNRRQFGSKYEVKTLLGISMLVMVKEDMFAHKLMAMYERIGFTHRDIFDVYMFAKNRWPINKAIVEERSSLSYRETLIKCIAMVNEIDNRYILDGLGELLSESQKGWARAKLKSDTIFELNLMLADANRGQGFLPSEALSS